MRISISPVGCKNIEKIPEMNKPQKVVLTVGAIIAIFMGLFPPWAYTFDYQSTSSAKPAGYSLILSPPDPEDNMPTFGVRLDSNRLFIQWIVVAFATGAGIALLHKRRDSQPTGADDA